MFPVTIIDEKARSQGLAYLVIGGHAVNAYCEPRATLDVDFLVRKTDAGKWRELLVAEGFKVTYDRAPFVQFSPPYGVEWRLDLMLVSDDTFQKMIATAKSVDLIGVRAMVPSYEHLIALKLHALKHGHPERFARDAGDVAALMRNAKLDLKSETIVQLFERFGTIELYDYFLRHSG